MRLDMSPPRHQQQQQRMLSAAAATPSTFNDNAHGGRALREWAQQYSVETEPLGRGSFASVSECGAFKSFGRLLVRYMLI